jgi:3-methylfumaryl-CoA hydratase
MLAAALDYEYYLARGDTLPPLWHWLIAPPTMRQSQLGSDGHPRRGDFLPPVKLERRMWAGSRVEFHTPLAVGETVRRQSTIMGIDHKDGASGALVFVRVEHRWTGPAGLAVMEEQDIVYRDFPKSAETPKRRPETVTGPSDWEWRLTPDPVLLFRYSAATYNGHRIHYDRDYATNVEGYSGLVVHGPLTATLMMEALRRHMLGHVHAFTFRGSRTLIAGEEITIRGNKTAEGDVAIFVFDANGDVVTRGSARLG